MKPTKNGLGVPLSRVLATPVLAGSSIVAGAAGAGRLVRRLNVMEVPDIHPWVRPGELLLTTGYSMRDDPSQLIDVITGLAERDVAALAIKLGRYLETLPPSVIARADQLRFPLVSLPRHVSFDDVVTDVMTELLSDRVARRAAGAARTDFVHRNLVDLVLAGGDLPAVADSLAEQLEAVVAVTTPDGRVIAASGGDADLSVLGPGPWHDRTGRLRTEHAAFALGLHDTEAAAVSYAVAEICAGGIDHGRLAAFSTTRRLEDDDLVAVQRSAGVCGLVITRELAVAAVGEQYRADYVRDLVMGRVDGDVDAVAHAATLGWDIGRPLVVMVMEPESTEQDPGSERPRRPVLERQAAAIRAALQQRDPRAAIAVLRTETIALVGLPAHRDVRQLVDDVVHVVRGHGGGGRKPFGVGVSRVCTSVSELSGAYEQARTAVRVGRLVDGTGAVTHFDDLGVYRLLSLVQHEGELQLFAQEFLGELAGSGDSATDLRHTLEVLIETNVNVAVSARRLHFHYNTLRYRIGRLEKIVGPFTTDAALRLNLAIALKVVSMRALR